MFTQGSLYVHTNRMLAQKVTLRGEASRVESTLWISDFWWVGYGGSTRFRVGGYGRGPEGGALARGGWVWSDVWPRRTKFHVHTSHSSRLRLVHSGPTWVRWVNRCE